MAGILSRHWEANPDIKEQILSMPQQERELFLAQRFKSTIIQQSVEVAFTHPTARIAHN